MRPAAALSLMLAALTGCVGDAVSMYHYSVHGAADSNTVATAKHVVNSVADQYGLVHREHDRYELPGCTRYVSGKPNDNPTIELSLCWSKAPMTLQIFESYAGYRNQRHGKLALTLRTQLEAAGLHLVDEKI
jgi:hypothetical protein